MMEFFKTFLKGLLVIILSPLWLIILALMILKILGEYLIDECLLVIYFFRGLNYLKDDRYSIKLKEALRKKEFVQTNNNIPNEITPPIQPQIVIINQGDAKLTAEQLEFLSKKATQQNQILPEIKENILEVVNHE